MRTRSLAFSLGLLFVAGCGVHTQHRDLQVQSASAAVPEQSLIPSDAAVLTDAEIHRILAERPTLPPEVRIALVHLEHQSHESIYYYSIPPSQDVRRMLGPRVVGHVRKSPFVLDASYLPLFLFSRTPTVAQLREAAARYQADLILLFSSDCTLHKKHNVFSANEARAHCRADSAVLDVRTGLVPFVSRAEYITTLDESKAELSVRETVLRAEVESVEGAMQDNAEAFAKFLADTHARQSREPASPAAAE